MITEKEHTIVELDPVKRDFYQIYNELLEVSSKISERWDASATNESDPGIVLLKVLTAIADKLNYQIDKNTLECFMPSATQQESMRKLCEMMGYNIKYYQSATTPITIKYNKSYDDVSGGIIIPKFTNVKDADDEINYILLEGKVLSSTNTVVSINAIEGELVACETEDDGVISINQLDDNFRYYLPETQIAENGIFIFTVNESQTLNYDSEQWVKVDNLNTAKLGSKVYKFGYDSKLNSPYVQFPEDIGSIIEDGIAIYYIRTNGINGNISVRTISKLEQPENWETLNPGISVDDLTVTNKQSSVDGRNIESLDDAYINYKKTIGTFDTLVTCRDYMNKIYQLTIADTDDDGTSNDTTSLVSNVIASDIRDDVNRAITICTFNDTGIKYIDTPISDQMGARINHFDLVLYPFMTIRDTNSKQEYINSFKYTQENTDRIETGIQKYKTISHNIIYPDSTDVVAYKLYYRLNAKITTTRRVNSIEEKSILTNIFTSIYKTFNLRKIDFGEELPYEDIKKCILTADSRIKDLDLQDPDIIRAVALASNDEYTATQPGAAYTYQKEINKATLKNVLAGRISLFNYNEDFATDYCESGATIYPASPLTIKQVSSAFTPTLPTTQGSPALTLKENEVLEFMAPNYTTDLTYSAYVNYFIKLLPNTKIISANADYKLEQNEWLVVLYTPATSDDGTTATPVYKIYESGTIIRPNFDLKSSNSLTTIPSQPAGFTNIPSAYRDEMKNANNIQGMYSLGISEQIETRKQLEVVLGKVNNTTYLENIYIYWERNNEVETSAGSGLTRLFTAAELSTGIILQEGEYLYYTDSSKLDFAFYGAGTKIIPGAAYPNNDVTKKILSETEKSDLSAAIATNGASALEDYWKQVYLGTATPSTKTLTIKEYQYITLAENDTLNLITFVSGSTTEVASANYKFYTAEDAENLPILPDTTHWTLTKKLNINMGPNKNQALYTDESITITYNDNTTTVINGTSGPLYLKSNYSSISGSGIIDAHAITAYFNDDGTVSYKDDYKVKTFTLNQADQSIKTFDTTGHSVIELTPTSSDVNLYVSIPTGYFGLIMMCYIGEEEGYTSATKYGSYITCTNSITPAIYNNLSSNTDVWWQDSGFISGTNYYLKNNTAKKLNIIKLSGSCTLTIHTGTDNSKLIFSKLCLVNTAAEFNPKLSWLQNGGDIKTLISGYDPNHTFYYNTTINAARAINLNNNIDTETMLSSIAWYDTNNVNNKFVVSEIDANYLSTGIIISSSSKVR